MSHRYFTLEEARAALPQVRELLKRAMEVLSRMQMLKPSAEKLAEAGSLNAGSGLGTVYVENLVVLQASVERLQEMGCQVKSLEEGLIDFPHLREGREVLLCWKLGEEDIEYWHELDAGFAGRMKISEDG